MELNSPSPYAWRHTFGVYLKAGESSPHSHIPDNYNLISYEYSNYA